jgi:hypothetical protein
MIIVKNIQGDEVNVTDIEAVLKRIRAQAAAEDIRITQHAQQEMVEEEITLNEIYEAIATAQVLENYFEHRRGACCLLNGLTANGRPLHIVCTTARPLLIIITVYEPKLPKWITPTQRRR